ncbi:hypothetical protein [Hyalangium gracile]|uniref:hypothetical protein n=1 Tax=Hyalangium gracile TaxID=394092 RepID=UPI001CD028BE|nr:hypothetical protein [Hyalangium gracile]
MAITRHNPLNKAAPLFNRFKKGVTDAVNRAQTKLAKEPGTQAKRVVDTFTAVRDGINGVRDQRQAVRTDGFKKTWKQNFSNASNPNIKFDKATALKTGQKALGLADNLRRLPGQVNTAIQDARQGFRSGASAEERDKAIGSVATAAKTTLSSVKGATELGRDATKIGSTYRQASKAFKAAAPEATRAARFAAASTATKEVLGGATKVNEIASAARGAVSDLVGGARRAVPSIMGGGTTKAANRALTTAAKEAAGAAVAKTAAKTAAKAGGRFVPGLNVAIAAADAATAYATVRDPKASTTKKVASVVTALGSAAAATNIPVVSQAGAAVSAVSSFVGGLFG